MPRRKILVRLAYPAKVISDAVDLFSRVLSREAAGTLCLASAYISPIMAVEDIEDFDVAIVGTIRTQMSLDEKAWKLHMRIADYTTLDFYAWSTENAWKAILEDRLAESLEERTRKVSADEKRYWRLKPGSGRVFLAYLDPLKIIFEEDLRDDLLRLGEEASSVLGLISAISI